MTEFADQQARERAAVVTDQNLVITAGAGTGKTSLLVDRLTHLLFREPAPLRIDQVVALTFTNKAANEMKLRLRDRLLALRELSGQQTPPPARRRDWDCLQILRARYGITTTEVDERTSLALRHLERSQIGTIHSFAAHLIRLYPLEAGVDPGFEQDEGERQEAHFREHWAQWLDRELGPQGVRHEQWRRLLGLASLEELRELTWRLVNELIPLEPLSQQLASPAVPPAIGAWLRGLLHEATALRAAHPKGTTLERLLDLTIGRLERIVAGGGPWTLPEEGELSRTVPPITKSWTAGEYERAKALIRVTQSLGTLDQTLAPVLELLVPFARECRRDFLRTGYISFDGLLARARDLLLHHPAIRRELKRTFSAILVDEFQDTDPVQYEIILCLAEAIGREETDWRRFQLAPGKLFIVGDPKQSIYAFRRADMQAYDAVVDELVLGGERPGAREALETNFRSHAALLGTLNGFFASLFPGAAQKGVQPRYEPLRAPEAECGALPTEMVQLRLVCPDEPEPDADAATRAEAEELARWLADAIGREEILDRGGRTILKPGHIAVLFRTLTTVREYVEALRRHGLPCVAEGERYFYERQEVVDVVNLLRAAVFADDRLALVSVLRSPLGGLSDREIFVLARERRLDYRLDGPAPGIYARLRRLHHELPRLPLPEVLPRVFEQLPLIELAAASGDGEQAVANLYKLQELTDALASRAEMTLPGLVHELTRRLMETPQETESRLTEETEEDEARGAIRLLSIHKAKGLEFPVVIVAGLHRGTDRRESRVMVQHDWYTGIVGLKVGDRQTLGGVYLGSKLAERQQAEQLRLLYVAMTRARRRLVLSAGLARSAPRDSFLRIVADRLGLDLETLRREPEAREVRVGDGVIRVQLLAGRMPALTIQPTPEDWQEPVEDLTAISASWASRARRFETSVGYAPYLTPTGQHRRARSPSGPGTARSDRGGAARSRLIGTLAHRVLEGWDFRQPGARLAARVEEVCRRTVVSGGPSREALREELLALFERFGASESYARLGRATILGREVPFLMPWRSVEPESAKQHDARAPLPAVMEGVIDLIYRLDGELWVADYKTDRVERDDLAPRVEEYRGQAEVYVRAVARCLAQPAVRMELLFLRCGAAVEVTGLGDV